MMKSFNMTTVNNLLGGDIYVHDRSNLFRLLC